MAERCAGGHARSSLQISTQVRRAIRARLTNTIDPDGTTALHRAVQRNDLDAVDKLTRAGADVKAANRYGVTPLQVAATNGNAPMIEKLLAAGADPNTALPEGETALMTAARTGNAAAVKSSGRTRRQGEREGRLEGQTALMWAAAENNVGRRQGADRRRRRHTGPVEGRGVHGISVCGSRRAHRHGSALLLDAGADVNEPMPDGTSPLLLALINAHFELAGFLLDRGADPNADGQGWTALHQVVWSRRPNTGFNLPGPVATGNLDSLDLVRKLVKLGANVNARQKKEPRDGYRNQLNRIGATPFLLAAKSVDLPLDASACSKTARTRRSRPTKGRPR